jgi:hypothetical protein
MTSARSNRWIGRRNRLLLVILLVLMTLAIAQVACSGSGACVGSGGSILRSPVCKNDWSRSECQEWDDEGINDANWEYHSGRTCEGLGYTERCSDDSYRWPGDC